MRRRSARIGSARCLTMNGCIIVKIMEYEPHGRHCRKGQREVLILLRRYCRRACDGNVAANRLRSPIAKHDG